ncbi:hypothetical protein [Desulfofarcimen acetoxidans]|uniref:hypothetical protein n=1 Tax=Desulfofarcimen acetoxidans TaxID=58138 RepID=UPI00019E5BEA|nr:hypothetical protein [Desulfofarcimen acetoxidans]
MLIAITILSFLPSAKAVYAEENYSMFYGHSRIFGKIVNYDSERNMVVIYGSIYVRDNNYTWQLIKSKKFTEIIPEYENIKQILISNMGKTVSCEGSLESWAGQNEEIFKAREVTPQEYAIETPNWYAFGKTIKTGIIYKYNLTDITDFVNILFGVYKAEKTENLQVIRKEFSKNWNTKWCITKNNSIADELRQGVGGWQIYQGLLVERFLINISIS